MTREAIATVDRIKQSYEDELKAKDERIEKEIGKVVDVIEQHEQDVSTIQILQMTIGDYKEIVKAEDKEILALIHRVADITKENIEANNRIAELEAKLAKLQEITQNKQYDYMFRSFLEAALNDTLDAPCTPKRNPN